MLTPGNGIRGSEAIKRLDESHLNQEVQDKSSDDDDGADEDAQPNSSGAPNRDPGQDDKDKEDAAKSAVSQESTRLQRPNGVPENWVEGPGRRPGHTKWVNPENKHDYVRQRRDGTITQVRDGKAFDANGNRVLLNSPEADGITREQFIFRE